MKARWHNTVLADSDLWQEVEGYIYFPLSSVRQALLVPSSTTTRCSWKGTAHYYDVIVDGEVNKDAAWYYPQPTAAAEKIKDCVAFGRGIEVTD